MDLFISKSLIATMNLILNFYTIPSSASPDDAQIALQTLANKKFEGRLLRIELAIRKNALKRVAKKMEQNQENEREKDKNDQGQEQEEEENNSKINIIKAKDLVARLKFKSQPQPVLLKNEQPTK